MSSFFKRSFSKILALAFLIAPLAIQRSSYASSCSGGSCGGGSTSFRKTPNAKPILLDLLTVDPDFDDSSEPRQASLDSSTETNLIGFDRFRIKNHRAYALALERLKLWEKSSPILVGLLRSSLESLEMRYTMDCVAEVPSRYVVTPELQSRWKNSVLESVVYYGAKVGAFASAPQWNELGLKSQAGALIHEALRRLQLKLGLRFTDEQIQALTGSVVLREPKSDEDTLETERYLDMNLLLLTKSRRDFERAAEDTRREACKNLDPRTSSYVRPCGDSLSNLPAFDFKSFYLALETPPKKRDIDSVLFGEVRPLFCDGSKDMLFTKAVREEARKPFRNCIFVSDEGSWARRTCLALLLKTDDLIRRGDEFDDLKDSIFRSIEQSDEHNRSRGNDDPGSVESVSEFAKHGRTPEEVRELGRVDDSFYKNGILKKCSR